MIEQVESLESLGSKEESCLWKKHTLGSFLIPINRSVSKPDKEFLGLGIRSHGKGTFLKPNSNPTKIGMKTLYQVKENDLIVNITFAWEGAVAIVEPEDHGALVSHRFPTYKFETDLAIPEFFKYVIIQDRFKYLLGIISPGGAGRNRVLNKTDFLKLEVEVPPLPEQKKIARIIGTWDRAIDLTERLIEAKERQKKGLMQQLLTGKERFREFVQNGKMQQSKVGLIPEDWDVVKIKDIAEVNRKSLTGKTPKNYVFNYIDLSAVKKGIIDFSTNKIRFNDAPSRARRILSKGDVIMATVRPYLQGFAIADFDVSDYICSTGFALITPKKDMDTQFIYESLYASFTERQIYGLLVGSNYPAINASDVENLWLVYPKNDRERAWIASTLSACDQEIELLQEKLEALKEQKKGLMQQLLTGKVRVKI